jgi:uncharacterized MAPEG superfamily protein
VCVVCVCVCVLCVCVYICVCVCVREGGTKESVEGSKGRILDIFSKLVDTSSNRFSDLYI